VNKTILAAVLLLCALTAGAQTVRYRSADTVYLTSGSAEGVAVGDRYEIVRKDAVIATVEVIFVAERSASAKVISESTPIAAGDAARRVGVGGRVPPPPPLTGGGLKPALRSPFSLSGTASFDAGDDRSLGRLSLRARHIADLPLHARVRARASSEENGNRLYEASLSYEGRLIGARVGRIGNTPYVGLGYLDGALVSVNVASFLQVGAFGGLQPDITDLTFDADATKYGAFARVFTDAADLVVAAATVENSPFVAVDGRWAATNRISLFAHGRAGDESFNTMAGVIGQLRPRQSVTVSYERVDPGPDDDLRTTDQVIDDFLRQGLRVSYRGPYATLGAGIRSGDEDDDPTYSATAGLAHPNLFGGVYAGVYATGFSSEFSDGVFAQLRAGRRFGGGHTAELSAGALVVDETALGELSSTAYLRGSVWIELPYDLFARGEAEFTSGTSGDSRTGHRVSLGAGYRF
jgi:hypothetical protein